MYSSIATAGIRGIHSFSVQAEVDVSQGLPSFDMVGLLGSEVREARERVKTALKNSGIVMPPMKITVNLSPADIRKEGTAFDLPIAVGLLRSMGVLGGKSTEGTFWIGELGLNGEIRKINGALPMVQEAKRNHFKRCIVPKENENEGGVISGIEVYGLSNIREVIRFLQNDFPPSFVPVKVNLAERLGKRDKDQSDFEDLYGQEVLRRAAVIAAAGFHHLLMIGPPGSSKTMAAKRIPSIMPDMNMEESLEVSSIYSVAGLLQMETSLITSRPFLNPHHTITEKALAGGGAVPRPGVLSLAHRGVLFLDELPEFRRSTLDILRQPLEERKVHIARNSGTFTYPADVLLVMAMNPCKCGYYPDRKRCSCSEYEIKRYLSHVSGPVLDRIDLITEAPEVEITQLQNPGKGESSAQMREKVYMARKFQENRFRESGLQFNSEMGPQDIRKYCRLGQEEERFMEQIFRNMKMSARGYHRVLKVARTIADLEQSEKIRVNHLSEAVCYRRTNEKYWHK